MIDCRALFLHLSKHLFDVLQSLSADEWLLPTRCQRWNVKDVAAHLVQTAIGRLSRQRDGYFLFRETVHGSSTFDQIVQHINHANTNWVNAWKDISPQLIMSFLHDVDVQLNEWIGHLPLMEKAPIAVAWAGETESLNWFDIAREYTERWHHQQHIREATGKALLLGRDLYHPVLDTFMRALPYTFRNIAAEPGTLLEVNIAGEAGGTWFLGTIDGTWQLLQSVVPERSVTSAIEIPEELAWKIFTKAVREDEMTCSIRLSGKKEVARQVLQMVSVMA